jgi:ADP-ribose pyrophosphatase YjhB (NUDIX family)
MEILRTIRDSDFGLIFPAVTPVRERRAARAIVFDPEKRVAILHVTNKHFHKLPGGGIEGEESIQEALQRECIEEIGCEIEHVRELGVIEEYRGKFNLYQLSYCFLADLAGEKGVPHLEPGELADGFETVWVSLDDAVNVLEAEANVEDYEGKFIQLRDIALLTEAQQKV